jgi:ABC-type nitrate/sulfonate/bicarbonate transport system permease component
MRADIDNAELCQFSTQIEVARAHAARTRLFGRLVQLGTAIGFLVVWETAVVGLGVSQIILPSVSDIAKALWAMTAEGTIPLHTMITVRRVLIGFAAAAALAVVVGLAMNRSHFVQNVFDPLIAALYPLPKIALVPLLLIWFGSGEVYKFVVVLATAFFPIVISTYQGLRQVDPGLVSTARDLGASEWRIQWEVMLPAATPAILAGMRVGMGVAIILTIAAEMIASQNGLGYLLVAVGAILETEKVFAILFTVAILGVAITKVHDWIDFRLAGWAIESRAK